MFLGLALVALGALLVERLGPTRPDPAMSELDEPTIAAAMAEEPADSTDMAEAQPEAPAAAEVAAGADAEVAHPQEVIAIVAKGDTLARLFQRVGVPASVAAEAIEALRGAWDPRQLKIGDRVTLTLGDDEDKLMAVGLRAAADLDLVVERQEGGGFQVIRHPRQLTRETAYGAGAITSSLYLAGQVAKLPHEVLHQLFQLFAYDVDFQRDIQPGDGFEVIYTHVLGPDGEVVAAGPILGANLVLSGKVLGVFHFKPSQGDADWFNRQGEGVRKALLRTPIDGARLTSGFGPRSHPLLGYTAQHNGVDFGAATGTPIMAAGDGVVERADWFGGYGNYVRLRHTPEFHTAYGHMSRFAAGIRPGVRVRQGQVIGHVGSTGMSTGPHLHYEVHRGGRPVDPRSVKMAPRRQLDRPNLDRFRAHVAGLDAQMARFGRPPELVRVARAEGR
jgi:murein DD-endopeptidase MepM/ murein hydrolase activator NlpD